MKPICDIIAGLALASAMAWLAFHFGRSAKMSTERTVHIFIRKTHVCVALCVSESLFVIAAIVPGVWFVHDVAKIVAAVMVAYLFSAYRGRTMPELLAEQRLGESVLEMDLARPAECVTQELSERVAAHNATLKSCVSRLSEIA